MLWANVFNLVPILIVFPDLNKEGTLFQVNSSNSAPKKIRSNVSLKAKQKRAHQINVHCVKSAQILFFFRSVFGHFSQSAKQATNWVGFFGMKLGVNGMQICSVD